MDNFSEPRNPKRFYRSQSNRVLGGVCAGIADRMGWEPVLLRVGAVVMVLTGVFSWAVILGYMVIWMFTPARRQRLNLSGEEEQFWQGVSDRPSATFSNIRYKFKDMDDRLANMERKMVDEDWLLRRKFRDLEGK